MLVEMISGDNVESDDSTSTEEMIEFKLFKLDRQIRRRSPFKFVVDYVSNKQGLKNARQTKTILITVRPFDKIADTLSRHEITVGPVEKVFDSSGQQLIINKTFEDYGITEDSKLVFQAPQDPPAFTNPNFPNKT